MLLAIIHLTNQDFFKKNSLWICSPSPSNSHLPGMCGPPPPPVPHRVWPLLILPSQPWSLFMYLDMHLWWNFVFLWIQCLVHLPTLLWGPISIPFDLFPILPFPVTSPLLDSLHNFVSIQGHHSCIMRQRVKLAWPVLRVWGKLGSLPVTGHLAAWRARESTKCANKLYAAY